MFLFSFLISSVIFSGSFCGRIDASVKKDHPTIVNEIVPSVDEDHIKLLEVKNISLYDDKAKGKPELFRTLVVKVHSMNTTDFDENEATTMLNPASTEHSHVYERTLHTKTTVHKTKKEKSKIASTTTEMTPVVHSRSIRSFTKEDMESFSEMGKVFSENFKKFNADAEKAEKDFMSFMEKLDKMSVSNDHKF